MGLIEDITVPANAQMFATLEAIQIPHIEVKGQESPLVCYLESRDIRELKEFKFVVPYPRLQIVMSKNLSYPLNRVVKKLNIKLRGGEKFKILASCPIERTYAPEIICCLNFLIVGDTLK